MMLKWSASDATSRGSAVLGMRADSCRGPMEATIPPSAMIGATARRASSRPHRPATTKETQAAMSDTVR